MDKHQSARNGEKGSPHEKTQHAQRNGREETDTRVRVTPTDGIHVGKALQSLRRWRYDVSHSS